MSPPRPAADEAPKPSTPRRWRVRGLRAKLMQLSLILTALGVVLLVVSSITVLWLRSNSNQLALRRTPAVVATQRAQIGLQRSLAGLRGWVALGDERLRSDRRAAWTQQIEPAIADIRSYSETWTDAADRDRLTELAHLLVELKESQWWVEDVARAEGNQPALQVWRGRVEPIALELRRVIDAVIADARAVPSRRALAALQAMVGFRDALAQAQHALARFVAEGEERWGREFSRALGEAAASVELMETESARLALPEQDRVDYLIRELPWYAHFAREALEARRSASWNVALYRMSTETIPLTLRVTELLDVLASNQAELMARDTRFITFAGNTALMSSVVLIVLMAAIAYALASYRAGQITRPISALANATVELADGRLKRDLPVTGDDELGTLTDAFNRMRVRLQESEAALLKSNGELTQKNRELEEAMQKLQTAQQALVMQEKMASLGALTAGVAHEIKNPLNFVTNFAELSTELAAELREVVSGARDKLGPDADQDIGELLTDIEDNARKIKEHGGRANSIVDGMLLHSRGVPGERQPTDLNKLLDEYVDLAYHGMRAKDTRFNITIERHYDPAVGVIHVVPQDMSRVFLNLINNACYATDEKKKSSGEEFSPIVRVSTKNLEGAVEVRVRDNGRGIPAKSLDKVFQPFFTTKPAGEGTGLGLSISYDVVVGTHQGEMRVESKEGEFAEFIITIPKV